MKIRTGKSEDVDVCILLGTAMHEESRYRHLSYDSEHCRRYADRLMNSENKLFLVAEEDGDVVGFLTGRVERQLFGPELLGQEELLYIRPERRNGMAGYKLMKEWMIWCREKGCVETTFATTAIQRDQCGALANRLGMHHAGNVYKWRTNYDTRRVA